MKAFSVDDIVLFDLLSTTRWYEEERDGLGAHFAKAVDAVFARIQNTEAFVTAPVLKRKRYVVRRERTRRFPYVIFFVETATARRVIAVLHERRDPRTWKARI